MKIDEKTRRFQFHVPSISFFEKADAAEGKTRRFGGLVSTESRDREEEVVLQRGLNFSPFIDHGWFNNNHSKDPTDVLGYPENIKFVKKGEALPNGRMSPADGHWAEGYLLDGYKKADEIWDLSRALNKTDGKRSLGFSIEGRILRRAGPDNRIIAQADVENVAITHCPVNTDTSLAVLAKALMSGDGGDNNGNSTGEAISLESLEHDAMNTACACFQCKKSNDVAKALKRVADCFPSISCELAMRIVRLAHGE